MFLRYNLRTVTAEDVPRDMRVPHIRHGYRLLYQPWSYYLRSLFHLHNETLNVWTHLVGCLVIASQIAAYYRLYSAAGSDLRWTVVAFGVCCLTTLFNSALAHLLHARSVYVNYVLFMYDYIGVVNWGFGTSILAVYGVSHPATYRWLGHTFLTIQVVWTYISHIAMCLTKLWYGHDLANMRRKFIIVGCILLQGASNFIPWFPRYVTCFMADDCHLSSLNHITIVCISFTIMTLSFVLHQPERYCHDKFDIFGQSHQIFHVTVVITQLLQFRALHVDFVAGDNAHCQPDISRLLGSFAVLQLACLSTVFLCRGSVPRATHQHYH